MPCARRRAWGRCSRDRTKGFGERHATRLEAGGHAAPRHLSCLVFREARSAWAWIIGRKTHAGDRFPAPRRSLGPLAAASGPPGESRDDHHKPLHNNHFGQIPSVRHGEGKIIEESPLAAIPRDLFFSGPEDRLRQASA